MNTNEKSVYELKCFTKSSTSFIHNLENNCNLTYEDNMGFKVYEFPDKIIYKYVSDEICCIDFLEYFYKEDKCIFYINDTVRTYNPKRPHLFMTTQMQMAVMQYLIKRNGFLLHSNAIKKGENVICFSGRSSVGKTTLSMLCHKASLEILTDETVLLWFDDMTIKVFSTHWNNSSANFYKRESGTLKGIYFLEHGKNNEIIPLEFRDFLPLLIKQTFPFFWSQQYMNTLIFKLIKIVKHIESGLFYFLPDDTAVEKILYLYDK